MVQNKTLFIVEIITKLSLDNNILIGFSLNAAVGLDSG